MNARIRKAVAILCAIAGCAGCLLLLGAHWRAEAFSARLSVPVRPRLRAASAGLALPHGTVNVNTADAQTLDTLVGVGPKTAQAILDERAQNGPFDYPQDLLLVKGIGEKTLARFYDQLDFSAPETAR